MTRIDYSDKQLKAMFGKPVRPGISFSLDQISTEAQKLAASPGSVKTSATHLERL